MEDGGFNFNMEIARYIVIVAGAPFWVPFIRKIWMEVENALQEEGGIFGRTPTPAQLAEIRKQKLNQEDPLLNEPYVRGMAQAPGRSQRKSSTAAPAGKSAAPPPRRGGFRS